MAACLEEEHLTDTRLRAAFDFFDRDGSGVVTEADMKQARCRTVVGSADGECCDELTWPQQLSGSHAFQAMQSLLTGTDRTLHRPIPSRRAAGGSVRRQPSNEFPPLPLL
jgi:hypothetical protein